MTATADHRTLTPSPEADLGLLSPVRVGTPVAAAVGDLAWLQAMLDAEAGLARAQARLGTVPAEAARVISEAARAEVIDAVAVARAARETANPVVGLVAAFTDVVARRDAGAAEYVHRGSTSQDVLDTGTMLVCRTALGLISDDLGRVARALGRLAVAHQDTAMTGRTLALHAVPTTFGLKAAGWRQGVLDARGRVERILGEGLPVSLGGAAGTLAGYLEYAGAGRAEDYDVRLAAAYADELGLHTPALPWHSLRAPVAEIAAALALTTGALGKIAVDVQSLARTEVAEVSEPPVAGRGASSAMPHKRNPVLSTLIRSAALQVPALASVVQQCMLAEDERSAGAWHAEWQPLREALRLTGGAAGCAAELVEGLVVRPERMRRNLELTGSQVVSERLAAVLTPRLGRAAAKALLTRAALEADLTGRPLGEVLAPDLPVPLSAAELADLLDPTRYTGAAGPLVRREFGPAPQEENR
ncbi:3-carboxy-cis,cis-muconate cycloisomerase [Streptomyces sp. NPDC046909]|uniref:3-carboxy-cis,cis-muconate cycloisomerase n=1 Tax=Streptomyces sp. NPDC046909 TaxID=3155617 RepID=UPI003405EC65